MKAIAAALLLLIAMTAQAKPIAIVIHGGAGTVSYTHLTLPTICSV